MNNSELIHLIKHFMRNEHKAVEEVGVATDSTG